MMLVNRYELQIEKLEIVRRIERSLEQDLEYVSKTYEDDGTKREKRENEYDEYDYRKKIALEYIMDNLDKLLK